MHCIDLLDQKLIISNLLILSVNYKYSLPSSKNHSKKYFPRFLIIYIFVNAWAILHSNLDYNTNLMLHTTLDIL